LSNIPGFARKRTSKKAPGINSERFINFDRSDLKTDREMSLLYLAAFLYIRYQTGL
jgi:hypothetical protein